MAHNYTLQVTAGPEYDMKTHKIVPVNSSTPTSFDSDLMSVDLNVRIQSYRGLPLNSPSTSPYFSLPPHDKSKDQYSIAFRLTLNEPINGDDLVFGNDFDHPIRDRLPPGFNTAFKIVKWVVDPGLDGDVYADKPYLYGPAVSSLNVLHVGDKTEKGAVIGEGEEGHEEAGLVFEEGGKEEGVNVRRERGVPETDAAARKKFFLSEERRKEWEWEAGRTYGCDFFNPYLDFNDFALRLPGFTLPIMKYWDGQGLRKEEQKKRSHTLRYVLKNRATGRVLFVVLFSLYLKEDVDEDGNVKPGVMEVAGKPFEMMDAKEKKKHGRATRGWWWGGGDGAGDDEESEEVSSGEGSGNENEAEVKEIVLDKSYDDDDVD